MPGLFMNATQQGTPADVSSCTGGGFVKILRELTAAVRAVVVVGVLYAIVGVTFAMPTRNVRAWRLSAWAVSAVAYAIHVGYERLRLRNSSVTAALHVALAAALGAFGLAVGAIAHSLSVGTTAEHQRRLLIA